MAEIQSPSAHKAGFAQSARLLAAPAAVVLGALLLRIWGLRWGMPSQPGAFSLHPDEGVNLVGGVLLRGEIRPHLRIGFYNYGSLYFLLWQVAASINSAYGFVRDSVGAGPNLAPSETVAALLQVGRLLSVAGGVATCALVYATGAAMWSRTAGLVGSVVMMVCPLAVLHSHFATVDATATCLVVAALWMSARVLRRPSLRDCAFAGLFCGMASAARYNVALVTLSAIAAAALAPSDRPAHRRPVAARVGLVLVGTGLGFLLGCPGALLESGAFMRDLAFEVRKSSTGMGLLFEGTGNGHVYHLVSSLRLSLGWPMLAIALGCTGLALVRRTPQALVVLAFALPYYAVIGSAQVRFMRYVLPLTPALALLIGWAFTEAARRSRTVAAFTVAGYTIGLGWCLAASLALLGSMTAPDARDLAANRLRALPQGSSIAFATTPWYWSPTLAAVFTAPAPGDVRNRLIRQEPASSHLRLPQAGREWDTSVLGPPEPDAVAISDLESQDALRLGKRDAVGFMARLEEGYDREVYGQRPSLLGYIVYGDRYLPNDLLYVCPKVTLWFRRGSDRP